MNQASSNAADSLGYSLYNYLNQGYFSKDSLLCTTQAHSSSFGMSGAPVPYALRNDNAISIILLACFCFIVIFGSRSYGLFSRQLKTLFRAPRERSDSIRETSGEMHVMVLFVVIYCLLLGISSYVLISEMVTSHFVFDSNAFIVFLLSAVFLAYFFVKWTMQSLVNLVFFRNKKNIQYIKEQVFISVCSGILLYPVVMLLVYFDLSIKSAAIFFAFVVIFHELLTFYKSWLIFFRQKGLFLQNILYFCALEITPLLAFGSMMVMMTNSLEINF